MPNKKVFVIKYAFTQGVSVRQADHDDGKYVWVKWPGALNGKMLVYKSEVYETAKDAVAAVQAQAKKRVSRLKKQIAELEKYEDPALAYNLCFGDRK